MHTAAANNLCMRWIARPAHSRRMRPRPRRSAFPRPPSAFLVPCLLLFVIATLLLLVKGTSAAAEEEETASPPPQRPPPRVIFRLAREAHRDGQLVVSARLFRMLLDGAAAAAAGPAHAGVLAARQELALVLSAPAYPAQRRAHEAATGDIAIGDRPLDEAADLLRHACAGHTAAAAAATATMTTTNRRPLNNDLLGCQTLLALVLKQQHLQAVLSREAPESASNWWEPEENVSARLSEAIELLSAVQEAYADHHGKDHTTTLAAATNLGLLLQEAEQLDEAQDMLAFAAAGFANRLGDAAGDTCVARQNLGALYEQRGNFEGATRAYQAALHGAEQLLDDAATHADGGDQAVRLAVAALTNLAHLTKRQDGSDAALPVYRRAFELADKQGPSTVTVADKAAGNLAACLLSTAGGDGTDAEAQALLRRATNAMAGDSRSGRGDDSGSVENSDTLNKIRRLQDDIERAKQGVQTWQEEMEGIVANAEKEDRERLELEQQTKV